MNTCETCKHWSRHTVKNKDFGFCNSPKWHPISLNVNEATDTKSVIVAYDPQTGKDFGCIHGEGVPSPYLIDILTEEEEITSNVLDEDGNPAWNPEENKNHGTIEIDEDARFNRGNLFQENP